MFYVMNNTPITIPINGISTSAMLITAPLLSGADPIVERFLLPVSWAIDALPINQKILPGMLPNRYSVITKIVRTFNPNQATTDTVMTYPITLEYLYPDSMQRVALTSAEEQKFLVLLTNKARTHYVLKPTPLGDLTPNTFIAVKHQSTMRFSPVISLSRAPSLQGRPQQQESLYRLEALYPDEPEHSTRLHMSYTYIQADGAYLIDSDAQ